jgi:hypothetical protein
LDHAFWRNTSLFFCPLSLKLVLFSSIFFI